MHIAMYFVIAITKQAASLSFVLAIQQEVSMTVDLSRTFV